MSIHDRIKEGDRIRLIRMGQDPDPIPGGTEGTVTHVADLHRFSNGSYQIGVKWDNGRTLSLVETDKWEKM